MNHCHTVTMEKERLKLIVKNLKCLVAALESEVYSDVRAYTYENNQKRSVMDYDEVFDDDDGGVTKSINNPYLLINDDDGDGL